MYATEKTQTCGSCLCEFIYPNFGPLVLKKFVVMQSTFLDILCLLFLNVQFEKYLPWRLIWSLNEWLLLEFFPKSLILFTYCYPVIGCFFLIWDGESGIVHFFVDQGEFTSRNRDGDFADFSAFADFFFQCFQSSAFLRISAVLSFPHFNQRKIERNAGKNAYKITLTEPQREMRKNCSQKYP